VGVPILQDITIAESGGCTEIAGYHNSGEWWMYRNWEIIFYLTMFVDSSLVYFSWRRSIRSVEFAVQKFVDLASCLFLAQQPPSGPGPHSRGF
jgi:hypothetical protein